MYIQDRFGSYRKASNGPRLIGIVRGTALLHVWRRRPIVFGQTHADARENARYDGYERAQHKKYDACRRQIIAPISKKEQAHHSSAGGKSVSCCLRKADLPKTVARRLREEDYTRRPVVCVPLTRQHRTARLQWCREHHNWTEQDWACVLFSDEIRFSLLSDCRRQLIWRESGTAYRPENMQEKDRYPTCSIMVGRHHDQWPHAPTCGCEWDYDGPTIH
ncbi:transposable element Tcb1 transposase [Trichonephila clavipes]|nr:transposable element Tcb1 transposase [Trichonephila clavipes]